jgi:hypothetical protein
MGAELTPEPPLLHDMDQPALDRAGRDRVYPKWATLCLLRSLGHPVLNASCITPSQGLDVVQSVAQRLCAASNTNRLLLRSDGGIEKRPYYRGGSTFEIDALLSRAARLFNLGRAVILMEPTNRFTNRLSATIRIDRSDRQHVGGVVIEVLGPGFDVSDLTRGGVMPQLRLLAEHVNWECYEEPWWSDFRSTVLMSPQMERRRRGQRLARLAHELLVGQGELLPGAPISAAASWLRERGYDALWDSFSPLTAARELARWYDDAFLVANALLGRPWRCLALSFSRLGDNRPVYWDVIDGHNKFGSGTAQSSRYRYGESK